MRPAFCRPMRIPTVVVVCCVAIGACDRERAKSPEELLAEDTTLALDLARASDALDDGDPDTAMALVDGDAPAPAPPEPHIEFSTPDPGAAPPPAAARPNPSANDNPATPAVNANPPRRIVAASAPGCSSPATDDQRRCLLALLARYDVELNTAYRELIARMRSDAGTAAGEPDPASVGDLRTAQRGWLVYRDRECRRRTRTREGELWGPVRARCLGELSDARARELRAM